MASNVTKLVPLFGNGRDDCGSSDIHLPRGMERLGQVTGCQNFRLAVGNLSVSPKLTQTFAKRRGIQGARYLQDNSKEITGFERSCALEGYHGSRMARLGIEHNIPDVDVSGRNFLFDAKWTGHRTDFKCDFRERRISKPNSFMPTLPRDYQIHRTNHLNGFMLHRELSHSPSKPFVIGSSEGYDLTSVPAIVLPVTVQSLCGKPSFSTDTRVNRPRSNNQMSGLFRIGANKKSYTYIDPVCGASASFVARLSEMASLEGETMRQENLKKLKKTKRLES